jgi:hypothetical protein
LRFQESGNADFFFRAKRKIIGIPCPLNPAAINCPFFPSTCPKCGNKSEVYPMTRPHFVRDGAGIFPVKEMALHVAVEIVLRGDDQRRVVGAVVLVDAVVGECGACAADDEGVIGEGD